MNPPALHPYPILDDARRATHAPVPEGVPLESCGICHQPITSAAEALSYRAPAATAPTQMAHAVCMVDDMTARLRLVGRFGIRAFRALR